VDNHHQESSSPVARRGDLRAARAGSAATQVGKAVAVQVGRVAVQADKAAVRAASAAVQADKVAVRAASAAVQADKVAVRAASAAVQAQAVEAVVRPVSPVVHPAARADSPAAVVRAARRVVRPASHRAVAHSAADSRRVDSNHRAVPVVRQRVVADGPLAGRQTVQADSRRLRLASRVVDRRVVDSHHSTVGNLANPVLRGDPDTVGSRDLASQDLASQGPVSQVRATPADREQQGTRVERPQATRVSPGWTIPEREVAPRRTRALLARVIHQRATERTRPRTSSAARRGRTRVSASTPPRSASSSLVRSRATSSTTASTRPSPSATRRRVTAWCRTT
jgi:hypothetical protein